MSAFSISVDIAAPAERVWKVMSDMERWHEWTPSVTSVRRFDGGPLAVGSRALVRQPSFPPAFWKVIAVQPGRSFTWVSWAPGLRVAADHGIEPTSSGARATLALNYTGVFGRMLARMTERITRRYLEFEAEGLKARSEDPAFRCAASPAGGPSYDKKGSARSDSSP